MTLSACHLPGTWLSKGFAGCGHSSSPHCNSSSLSHFTDGKTEARRGWGTCQLPMAGGGVLNVHLVGLLYPGALRTVPGT